MTAVVAIGGLFAVVVLLVGLCRLRRLMAELQRMTHRYEEEVEERDSRPWGEP